MTSTLKRIYYSLENIKLHLLSIVVRLSSRSSIKMALYPPVCTFVCPFDHLSIACLFIRPSICISVNLFVCIAILSDRPFVYREDCSTLFIRSGCKIVAQISRMIYNFRLLGPWGSHGSCRGQYGVFLHYRIAKNINLSNSKGLNDRSILLIISMDHIFRNAVKYSRLIIAASNEK